MEPVQSLPASSASGPPSADWRACSKSSVRRAAGSHHGSSGVIASFCSWWRQLSEAGWSTADCDGARSKYGSKLGFQLLCALHVACSFPGTPSGSNSSSW